MWQLKAQGTVQKDFLKRTSPLFIQLRAGRSMGPAAKSPPHVPGSHTRCARLPLSQGSAGCHCFPSPADHCHCSPSHTPQREKGRERAFKTASERESINFPPSNTHILLCDPTLIFKWRMCQGWRMTESGIRSYSVTYQLGSLGRVTNSCFTHEEAEAP